MITVEHAPEWESLADKALGWRMLRFRGPDHFVIHASIKASWTESNYRQLLRSVKAAIAKRDWFASQRITPTPSKPREAV